MTTVEAIAIEAIEAIAVTALTTAGATTLLEDGVVGELCDALEREAPLLQEAAADASLSLSSEVCSWHGDKGKAGRQALAPLAVSLTACATNANSSKCLRALALRSLGKVAAAGCVPPDNVAAVVACIVQCTGVRALLSAAAAVMHVLCATADGRAALLVHPNLTQVLHRCLRCPKSRRDGLACSALLHLARERPLSMPAETVADQPASTASTTGCPGDLGGHALPALLWPLTVSAFIAELWQAKPMLMPAALGVDAPPSMPSDASSGSGCPWEVEGRSPPPPIDTHTHGRRAASLQIGSRWSLV